MVMVLKDAEDRVDGDCIVYARLVGVRVVDDD